MKELKIKLQEYAGGLIHICDSDKGVHKSFRTPNADGTEFTEALKKASVVYISFDERTYPCCGKPDSKSKNSSYEEFHVDRIRRILESGKEKAVIPKNQNTTKIMTLRTLKEKISWIASSLLELGVHHTYAIQREQNIDRIEWELNLCPYCGKQRGDC